MSSVGISIRGIPEVQKALAQLDDKGDKAMLQKAATAGAKALKPYVVAAAPRGATGKLKRSISARKAKRNLPAAVVSPRPKVAFYRHMVIGGTKDHGPRRARMLAWQTPDGPAFARRVRGTPARPFVDEGFRAGQSSAMAAIDKVIDAALETLK